MGARTAIFTVIAGIVAIAAAEVGLLSREVPRAGEDLLPAAMQTLKPREDGMADRLVFTDTRDGFAAGELRHVSIADDPARIVLDYPKFKGYPREGTWNSPRAQAEFPFTELLPSWNASTPTNTGVVFHVRTRDKASGTWTPWLRIGGWGRYTSKQRLDKCNFGYIDEDTLKLNRPADAYQLRATLQAFDFDTSINPSIRRIAITYSGPEGVSGPARNLRVDPGPVESWARSLDVPYIPQGDNADAVTGMTCSPTSVSMVLRYWGVNRPTMENCLAIWDDHNDLFGNWANATQRAGELGLDAWLQRFRNWDQVKALIACGQPVVASIRYEKGTMAGSPNPELAKWETDGHLLVIRGFTADGNVIVNDPSNRRLGNGLVMSAKGLAHAWFDHGGVGYVIHPPAKPIPSFLVKASPPSTQPAPRGSATTAPVATSLAR
jgi:hypothetical protein